VLLLEDYLVGLPQNEPENLRITVTNLTPFGSYNVFFYGAGSESGQGSTFLGGGLSATWSFR
jgi:hypothetical protein